MPKLHRWESLESADLSVLPSIQRARIVPDSIIRALDLCSICSMIRARIAQGPRSIFVYVDADGGVFIGTRPVPLCGVPASPANTSSGHVWASPVYSSSSSSGTSSGTSSGAGSGARKGSREGSSGPSSEPPTASVTHVCARCGMRKVLTWGAGERRGAVLIYYHSDGSESLEWHALGRVVPACKAIPS